MEWGETYHSECRVLFFPPKMTCTHTHKYPSTWSHPQLPPGKATGSFTAAPPHSLLKGWSQQWGRSGRSCDWAPAPRPAFEASEKEELPWGQGWSRQGGGWLVSSHRSEISCSMCSGSSCPLSLGLVILPVLIILPVLKASCAVTKLSLSKKCKGNWAATGTYTLKVCSCACTFRGLESISHISSLSTYIEVTNGWETQSLKNKQNDQKQRKKSFILEIIETVFFPLVPFLLIVWFSK